VGEFTISPEKIREASDLIISLDQDAFSTCKLMLQIESEEEKLNLDRRRREPLATLTSLLRALLTDSPPVLLKRMGGYFDVDTGSSGKVQI
jgi:hypothetical protein